MNRTRSLSRGHDVSDRPYQLGIVGGYIVEVDAEGCPVDRPDWMDLGEWLTVKPRRADRIALVHATSLARALEAASAGLFVAGAL